MTKTREIPYHTPVGTLTVGMVLKNADGTRPKIIFLQEFSDGLGGLVRIISTDDGEVTEPVPTTTLITVVSDN